MQFEEIRLVERIGRGKIPNSAATYKLLAHV